MNAASFEPGQAFPQRGQGGGMRVADGNRPTLLLGFPCGFFKLGEDRSARLDVVEESGAVGSVNAFALSGIESHGFRGGAAIDKKQAMLPQGGHQCGHQLRISRGARSLMIIHSRGMRHRFQHR